MAKTRQPTYRSSQCWICKKEMPRASRGRVRHTCSDRCRQIKRRRNQRWIDKRRWEQASRRAERDLRKLEQRVGSLDVPTPGYPLGYPYLTLRVRIKLRMERNMPIFFCEVCDRPYINDAPRRTPACPDRCTRLYNEQQRAIQTGITAFAGEYDSRVDVRLRLGLPIRVCAHCGKPFPEYDVRQKYCSDQCCRNASYARNPKKLCPECGITYRGFARTCSKHCLGLHYKHVTGLFCARCRHAIKPGNEMPPNDDTRLPHQRPTVRGVLRPMVFCSARCRDALGWSPSYKFCKVCGELYWPKRAQAQRAQQYCSDTCARAAHNATARASNREQSLREQAHSPRHCRWCSAELPATYLHGGRGWYCNEECKRLAVNERSLRAYYARKERGAALGIPVEMPVRVQIREPVPM